MQLGDFPHWFFPTTAVLFGVCFGSFLNVVIYRLPRGMSLSHPPSTCPACGTPIRAYDNVPVVGWLALRGKARCCGARVTIRYPLIEALGGLLAWSLFEISFRHQPELALGTFLVLYFAELALGLGLIALAAIDLEFMLLPDSLTYGGTLLGIAVAHFRPGFGLADSLSGAFFGFMVIWGPFVYLHEKVRGYAGMGLGDAKLVMMAGAWFGWFGVLFALFFGSMQGTLGALVAYAFKGKIDEPVAIKEEREALKLAISEASGEEKAELEKILREDPALVEPENGKRLVRIPFGPFLALSILELLLFSDIIKTFATVWFWEQGL